MSDAECSCCDIAASATAVVRAVVGDVQPVLQFPNTVVGIVVMTKHSCCKDLIRQDRNGEQVSALNRVTVVMLHDGGLKMQVEKKR